jgi:hypothetical protein
VVSRREVIGSEGILIDKMENERFFGKKYSLWGGGVAAAQTSECLKRLLARITLSSTNFTHYTTSSPRIQTRSFLYQIKRAIELYSVMLTSLDLIMLSLTHVVDTEATPAAFNPIIDNF